MSKYISEHSPNFKQLTYQILEYPTIKSIFALVFTAIHWCFDGVFDGIWVVLALLVMDTITGTLKGFKNHNVSSLAFARSAYKAFMYFILMATGSLVDKTFPISFALSAMVAFLAVTEAISIMENISELGLPVPTALTKRLRVMNEDK